MISRGHEASSSATALPGSGWLKADFHLHTGEDPKDFLDYSAVDLLHRAHALGFHALSITLHGQVLEDPAVTEMARSLGIRLIPGVELRLEGADVVIVNVTADEAAEVHRLDDLAAFRERRGKSALIIAPHPYYVLGGSMGDRLLDYIDVFDAVEFCHFHTAWFDRNPPAMQVAERFQKPVVATSDAHRLTTFGRHYSLIQAARDAEPEAIFEAIRAHCVKPVSPHLDGAQFARHLWFIFAEHKWRAWRARHAKRG